MCRHEIYFYDRVSAIDLNFIRYQLQCFSDIVFAIISLYQRHFVHDLTLHLIQGSENYYNHFQFDDS